MATTGNLDAESCKSTAVVKKQIILLCYVVEQGEVHRPGQILYVLPADSRADLPFSTRFEGITASNAASPDQESQAGKRGDLSIHVDGAAEIVRQYGVQNRQQAIQSKRCWCKEMTRQFSVLTCFSSTRAGSATAFLSSLLFARFHEVYLIQACRI